VQNNDELDPSIDADDPALNALAGAILDGTPVDWKTVESGAAASFLDEFRLLAGVVAVHRTLPHQPGAETPTEKRLASPGTPIGQWGTLALLDRIGKGAFGEVFRAWDRRLDREVALKLLHTADESSTYDAHAAIEEGRLLARVRHPNVVSVYGAERLDGRVGVWTEFVHGRTLADWIREHGRFSADEAITIGIDLCRALAAVHRAGLLHRDIKPQNIMREQGGRIVLMDFGAGKDRRWETLGSTRELTGTPLYLAPELLQGATATPQSDLYSVGIVLYQLVTGAFPVSGSTIDELRDAHEVGRRRLLRDERPELSDRFIQIIERALDPDPAKRYESAGAFEAALRSAQQGVHQPRRPSTGLWLTAAAIIIAVVSVPLGVAKCRAGQGDSARTTTPFATQSRRRLPLPPHIWPPRPSRDGRVMSYVDPDKFDVWLWDIASRSARRVTNTDNTGEEGEYSVPSPDGSRIAYTWLTSANVYELRVINADGTNMRPLLPTETASDFIPIEWSRDGTRILCWLEQKDGSWDLALISADGDSHRRLLRFPERVPSAASLSPDKRFVVFDLPESESQRDLYIVRTDGSSLPRPLLTHPADDRLPLWISDSEILFFSNRFRQPSAFVLNVADGVAQGTPVLVAKNLDVVSGRAAPIALTDDGTFFYLQSTSDIDVLTATVDLHAPMSVGQPAPVAGQILGERLQAAWSPDGAWLAYIDRRAGLLDLKNLRTGEIQEKAVLTGLDSGSPQRWSPDSHSLIVKGTNRQNQHGYFRVDLETGETTPAVLVDAPSNQTDYGGIDWSHDGASVLFGHTPRGIVSRELSTGMEVVVADRDELPRFGRFRLSPDGRSLALSGVVGNPPNATEVLRVRTDAGPFREVISFPVPKSPTTLQFQQWNTDGQSLIYTRQSGAKDEPYHLWIVPVAGGSPLDLGPLPGFTRLNALVSISPDGKQVAYTTGRISNEPWVMERFLPGARPAAR
jgi:serine/threonine-protein kinase